MNTISGIMRICLVGILLTALCGCDETSNDNDSDVGKKVVRVETGSLKEGLFIKQLRALGVIKPENNAVIAAKTNGNIDCLFVKEGSVVKKGDLLFQIDKVNLENEVLAAQQALKAAQETLANTAADINIAKTNQSKAAIDCKRTQQLLQNEAISKSEAETDLVRLKNADSEYKKAVSAQNSANVALQQAQTTLLIAEKNLDDSKVTAPYDGVITRRVKDVGDYAESADAVLEIQTNNLLKIACRISAIHYGKITTGMIMLVDIGDKVIDIPISYIAPNVDTMSKTFEIYGYIPADKNAVCGLSCDVEIILEKHNAKGIETNAIIARKNGKYSIFLNEDGKAVEKEVSIGLENDKLTEVFNSEDFEKSNIIISGQYFLNDGDKIELINKKGDK